MAFEEDLDMLKEARKAKVEGLPTEAEFKKLKEEEAVAFEEFKKASQ